MADETFDVVIMCFGPMVDELGFRESVIKVSNISTPRQIIIELNAERWIDAGIKVALDGDFVNLDYEIKQKCELALLPPVSGG